MKKLLSMLFASLVIFSLAMPVFADDSAPAGTTKTKKTKSHKMGGKKGKSKTGETTSTQ